MASTRGAPSGGRHAKGQSKVQHTHTPTRTHTHNTGTLKTTHAHRYIPREWMMTEAYTGRSAHQRYHLQPISSGGYSLVRQLHELLLRPYGEQVEHEAKYYRKTPVHSGPHNPNHPNHPHLGAVAGPRWHLLHELIVVRKAQGGRRAGDSPCEAAGGKDLRLCLWLRSSRFALL